MRKGFLAAVICGVMVPGVSVATEKDRSALDLLFNSKHLELLQKGNELTYRFERKVSDAKVAGEGFDDVITITISNLTAEGAKNVVLKVFSGERGRNPFETPGMTGNPLLMWYLDRAVSSYRSIAGGSVNYLKAQFRNAIRDNAEVTQAKFTFDGTEIEGYKVKIVPYENDRSKSRMQGYELSRFELLVGEDVPGFFYDMSAHYESTVDATPKIVERVTLLNSGDKQ